MNGSLFLTPEIPDSTFENKQSLIDCLEKLELISHYTEDYFLCGDQFAQLITFMGCSPHLVFSPPEDGSDKFCHIKIHHYAQPKLFTGQQTAPPRCPVCRFRISDWKENLLQNMNAAWQCPKCQHESAISGLDWRQSGGAGKILVEIKNIFPGEAVPVDKLLTALKELSGEKWKYFYIV